MIVGGQHSLDLSFPDSNYVVEPGELLGIEIIESVGSLLPTIEVSLNVPKVDNSMRPISDGNLIQVNLESFAGSGDSEYMEFRVFSMNSTSSEDAYYPVVSGYYNAPDYFKDSKFYSVVGSSSDVAERVARDSGLTPVVDSSVDSQSWIRRGTSGGQFLLETSRNAYKNKTSAYVGCVTRSGELLYYNVGERRRSEATWKFVETKNLAQEEQEDVVYVPDFSSRSSAGLLNRWKGYGTLLSEVDFVGTGNESQVYVDSLEKTTDNLQMNAELTVPSTFEVPFFNIGNTHKNFSLASMQNLQILSTYSTGIVTIFPIPKNVKLLDRVRFVHTSYVPNSLQEDFTGEYFIDRIITRVSEAGLIREVYLVKEGQNAAVPSKELH